MLTIYPTREQMLDALPKNAVVAEIGVLMGAFSNEILCRCQPRELHLIDPWAPSDEQIFAGVPREVWDGIYAGICRWAEGKPVQVHRGLSSDVLATFADDYFDWNYIDGNHAYPFAVKDLDLCWHKTKLGGHVCGHDWNFPQVQSAGIEAIQSGRYQLLGLTPTMQPFPSFKLKVCNSTVPTG